MADDGAHAQADGFGPAWADRETFLDVLVNLVPVGILVFFEIVFLMMTPWGHDPVAFAFMHFLTVLPLVLLLFVTYYSAKIITRDER